MILIDFYAYPYGLSFIYGDVLRSKGMTTIPSNQLLIEKTAHKERIGLDSQYLYGSLLFKGEVALGKEDEFDEAGYLLEADYTFPQNFLSPNRALMAYTMVPICSMFF